MGRRHRAAYRLTAIDKRRPRDSRVIEELGSFNPVFPKEDAQLQLNRERIEYWLGVGAQPTETVRRILEKQGLLPASGGKAPATRG
jgi:small subunit ribosomal protein S16